MLKRWVVSLLSPYNLIDLLIIYVLLKPALRGTPYPIMKKTTLILLSLWISQGVLAQQMDMKKPAFHNEPHLPFYAETV